MKLAPFLLERWLLHPCTYDLASAGITKLKLKDLTTDIDYEMLMAYGITKGSRLIREQIAGLYENVDAENILVTSGTAEANLLTLMRLLEPGDECIALLPTYLQCVNLAKSFGAEVKCCHYQEDDGYRPAMTRLRDLATSRTKLIVCVNPNNPTGSVITGDEMRTMCEIADGVGAWILCDGALRGLEVEGGTASSPVEVYERGIATGSLSKLGLTGIRIGWLAANKELIDECWAYKDYTTLCHPGIGEHLAQIALQRTNFARYIERAQGIIRTNRGILSEWVSAYNPVVQWVQPKAGHTAFIAYDLDVDSESLCRQVLQEEGVLVSPGDYFGSSKHLRVRYSCDSQILEGALERLGRNLARRRT